jgi:hypothetical protein
MQDRVEMWKTLRQLVTVTAIIGGAYFLVVRPIEHALTGTKISMEHGLKEVLAAITNRDTRVVEGKAEIVGSSEISEISLLEMRMNATRTIEKSASFSGVPLGTKKLIVRGHFRVKGGYRLENGISLKMENGQVVARFPKPEILSVELLDYEVLSEDSGWMNRIQPADRAQILRELREQMRAEAENSGMLDSISATLHTRLRDLIGAKNVRIESTLP